MEIDYSINHRAADMQSVSGRGAMSSHQKTRCAESEHGSASGACSLVGCLLAAVVLMESSVYVQLDVRERYETCQPTAGLPSESLSVVINRLEWLRYNLVVAVTGALLLVFTAFASRVVHPRGFIGRARAHGRSRYYSKLFRFLVMLVTIVCCATALAIAVFAPLDFLSHLIDGCADTVTGRYRLLAGRLWIACILLTMSAAWGCVWALESVSSESFSYAQI
jgi:hypothetical protein